jgi:hypothetical protein
MFLAQGPNSFWFPLTFATFTPPAIAVVYGIVLCVRNSSRKPDTARLVGIVIALLVFGRFSSDVLITMGLQMGWWDPAGSVSFPILCYFVQAVLLAAGLALLFRAAFLDETPLEFDPGPPVYRNDDGPAADG